MSREGVEAITKLRIAIENGITRIGIKKCHKKSINQWNTLKESNGMQWLQTMMGGLR